MPVKPSVRTRTAIRRQNAETYLLITLLSFATSVAFTRLFLEVTGYPQLGSGEYHIAHVLWGGLLLFIGALLPLIIANRWAFSLSALLTGIGVGLFIDEVGKFITQTNDYFYPTAAPIIYIFFLLTVLLYILIRRNRENDARSELYTILQDLEELVDRDFSELEHRRMMRRLDKVIEMDTEPERVYFARSLRDFIESEHLSLIPHEPSLPQRLMARFEAWEKTYLSRLRHKALMTGSLAAVAIWMISYPVRVILNARSPVELEIILSELVEARIVRNPSGLTLFGARVGLEGSIGLVLLVALVFILLGYERRGIFLAYLGLLFSMTIVDLMLFYFDQFSTITTAVIQFIVFLLLLRYRARFLEGI